MAKNGLPLALITKLIKTLQVTTLLTSIDYEKANTNNHNRINKAR